MVRRTVIGIALVALCLVLPAGTAFAEGEDTITADQYDVQETSRISISAVGNVIHKDELVYDREFFDAQSANFEEYPFLLSRRYRAQENVDEIQDFRADLDKEAATVTLTFRETGRAYNMGDYWIMYGFFAEPADIKGREMIIEEESTVNSDYTLWQDLDFKTTTIVSFPQGATSIRWDEGESAVTWEMPAQLAALAVDPGNALQQNQAVFITLFAVLLAGSLGTAVVVLARGRRTAAATAGTAGTATSAPSATGAATTTPAANTASAAAEAGALAATLSPTPPAAAPAIAETPPAAGATPTVEAATADVPSTETTAEARPAEERPHFCRYCGLHLPDADVHFCPGCGKDLGHRDP